ncbi:hypothetical protein FRACYDRAFT_241069 [Fragilariopsis cylindrus CCMP1102]|uniref:Uncharacterized protein n=1 Tax=Fragilariopsis cylindrus CCMP1102 TaxID=635003 RepID=A0A1E7F9K9_9STRA|nr:hypothetical protein FRACYDRAFT_241069 [Fragilariopsis cylindrus CCMP1102]|eukprot:OEU14523.1 hypothetical protein FRACYDRAFT_241069 [Fragilariopsis cylindrus CCMP1102]
MTDQDASDTKDRCAVVRENVNSLKQSARTFTMQALEKEFDALQALQKELGDGSYFAKASDIFPKDSAVHKTFKDIQGKADTFQRVATLNLYDGPRNQFIKHLTDAETESLPDAGSIATEASQASVPSVSGTDPKACLLQDVPGNKGHQGSDSKNCSAWWGLVYSWMIGKIDNLDAFLKDIKNEDDTDEKQLLKDRLNKAFVFLANGTMGGTSGMRSNDRNILFVPDPHDAYYDSGCNWVIYPIMTSEQMLEWKGESYWVSIFCGEKLVGEDKGDIWKDGSSKKTAQQAEAQITNRMPSNSERISVCSTTDLKVVGEGLAEMSLALADLHTRKSSTTAFKARIIDLASTIQQYLVENKKDPLEKITEEFIAFIDGKIALEKITEEDTAIIDLQQYRNKLASRQITIGGRKHTFDLIKTGINDLVLHLETNGIDVPVAPRKNHFGNKGKHVCKAYIRQSNPPDPIVVAAKGTNNLNRQWGVRLLSGSGFSGDDDSSSAGNSCTSMTPDKDFVGASVVASERLDHPYNDEDDSLSNDEDDF